MLRFFHDNFLPCDLFILVEKGKYDTGLARIRSVGE